MLIPIKYYDSYKSPEELKKERSERKAKRTFAKLRSQRKKKKK